MNIITEFRFDIASAVADSKTLQNQVGLISDTANQALYSLRRVGFGLVAQMGLFSGGMLGFFNNAIQASEKFGQSQRKLANIFLSNQDAFGGQAMTFASAMSQSAKIMDDVRKKGFEFAIDPSELLAQTSSIAPMLISHGLDDAKLSKSIDISRGLLKSAPTLGIDPSMIQGQLINLVMGRAGLDNTLFQRLMSETKPFKDNNIVDSKSFNIIPAQKRIEILRQSLLQFGSNAEVISGNINSMSGQMQKFFSLIKGQFAIVKPLGDALMKPIIKSLQYLNQWLDTNGRQMIQSVTNLIEGFIEDPIKAFQKLRQLGELKTDTILAGKLAFIFEVFHLGTFVLGLFGVKVFSVMNIVGGAFRGLLGWIIAIVPWMKVFGVLMYALKAIFIAVARVLVPLLFFLQIFSATIAKLEVIWASWMTGNAGNMTQVFERIGLAFTRIMLPITEAIEGISDILSGILGWFVTKDIILSFFEKLADVLEWLAGVMVSTMAIFAGVGAALGSMVGDLQQMRFAGITDRMGDAYDEGAYDYWKKIYKIKDNPDDMPVSQQVTNIGKVEINQAFKEQMEPDRIAFSMVEQLKKIAMNPSQAAGRTSSSGLVGQ